MKRIKAKKIVACDIVCSLIVNQYSLNEEAALYQV
jgi:hypothetical protein